MHMHSLLVQPCLPCYSASFAVAVAPVACEVAAAARGCDMHASAMPGQPGRSAEGKHASGHKVWRNCAVPEMLIVNVNRVDVNVNVTVWACGWDRKDSEAGGAAKHTRRC